MTSVGVVPAPAPATSPAALGRHHLTDTVSVVIPTYNRRTMLLRAVSTVLAQRDVAVEVIVVDNGSTDGSAAAVRQQFGDRVRVLQVDRTLDPGAARNAGAAQASGVWIGFLDDDDVWAPTKLAMQLQAARLTGAEWVYAGAVTVDANLAIVGAARPDGPDVIHRELPVRNRVQAGPSNVLVRFGTWRRSGPFDPQLRYHQDWDLWIRFAQLGPPAMAEHPLVGYVVHQGNMVLDGMMAEVDIIDARYRDVRGGRAIDRSAVHRWIAGTYLRNGQRGAAALAYGRAMRHDLPTSLRKAAAIAWDPRVGRRTTYRQPGQEDWRAEAEAWLAPLRAPGSGRARP